MGGKVPVPAPCHAFQTRNREWSSAHRTPLWLQSKGHYSLLQITINRGCTSVLLSVTLITGSTWEAWHWDCNRSATWEPCHHSDGLGWDHYFPQHTAEQSSSSKMQAGLERNHIDGASTTLFAHQRWEKAWIIPFPPYKDNRKHSSIHDTQKDVWEYITSTICLTIVDPSSHD